VRTTIVAAKSKLGTDLADNGVASGNPEAIQVSDITADDDLQANVVSFNTF
jgi:hypothetical protein